MGSSMRKPFWSIAGSWSKTIARMAQNYGARAIFWSGPNIWFLEPPEGCFEAFLVLGPKPLPERLKTMAREPFFGLDRISGFWRLQKTVLKHSGFWPKTIARTAQKYGAQAIFRSGPNICFMQPARWSEICKNRLVFGNRIAEPDTPVAIVMLRYPKSHAFLAITLQKLTPLSHMC